MKIVNPFLATALFVMVGCISCKQSDSKNDDLITIDVTKSYPKKELILQDFMDVEYIPLETNDEFVNQGFVQAVGQDVVIVKNFLNDGNIFIFDRRTGKAIKKINRRGQGSEEYAHIYRITLDEDNNEMFVNDVMGQKNVVYDLNGNFKRSFKYIEGRFNNYMCHFDREHFICYDSYVSDDGEANEQAFMIISKQDGSITKEIQLPFKEKIITNIIMRDASGMLWGASPNTHYPIIPYHDSWILVESSSDTIYNYSPDHTMTPIIVRTPTIQTMDPEVFLFPGAVLTDRYYFMEAVKKEFNFGANSGYPSTKLVYDKQEKSIFEYTLCNDDYSNKKRETMEWGPWIPVDNKTATWLHLEAHRLVEAYEEGKLKGQLEEIAATLDEESNPVIMLIKHKK